MNSFVQTKNNMKNKSSKKAFSMIEIIFALVVVAVIAALIIQNVRSTKRNTEVTSTIQNDIKNIFNAAARWRDQGADSDGTFNNISTSELCPYLPSSMKCDGTYIYSSGFKDSNNQGMIKYKILSYKIAKDGDSFKIFMDATALASARNWGDRAKQGAEAAFDDICKKISNNKNVTIDNLATDIGSANAGFTDGGTTTDGEAGEAGLTE